MTFQVNTILFKQRLLNRLFLRCAHTGNNNIKILHPLQCRRLIKVTGNDSGAFLQGLITNDMRHFEEGAQSMYAMFLNNKGRVLYDTLIHKWDDENSYLLECDENVVTQLCKHLKIYKLKRAVDITDASDNFKLWALTSPNPIPESKVDTRLKINMYKDPRLPDLGQRLLVLSSVKEAELLEFVGNDTKVEKNHDGYKYLRYKLGVSEGSEDLPPGTSFPLEANCDYLHGVSFHKGCYIGQELTARVHHTGVVRKRIMPLKFTDKVEENLEKEAVISNIQKPKSNLGKLKGHINDYGLGLLRIKEALDAKTLAIGKNAVEIFKPSWWPIEAPKEKVGPIKLE